MITELNLPNLDERLRNLKSVVKYIFQILYFLQSDVHELKIKGIIEKVMDQKKTTKSAKPLTNQGPSGNDDNQSMISDQKQNQLPASDNLDATLLMSTDEIIAKNQATSIDINNMNPL